MSHNSSLLIVQEMATVSCAVTDWSCYLQLFVFCRIALRITMVTTLLAEVLLLVRCWKSQSTFYKFYSIFHSFTVLLAISVLALEVFYGVRSGRYPAVERTFDLRLVITILLSALAFPPFWKEKKDSLSEKNRDSEVFMI